MAITTSGDTINIDYTGREYNDFRDDFFELADALWPEWDQHEFDEVNMVSEYQSRLGQYLSFMENRMSEENYINTCKTFTSAKRIGKAYNKYPTNPTTATVTETVTVTEAGIIPKYFRIGTEATADSEAIEYELLEDYAVNVAGNYNIIFHHGVTFQNEILGTSNGKPGQLFTIYRTPIAYNSNGNPTIVVEVEVGDSWEEWTLVTNFLDSTTTSKHVVTTMLESGEFQLQFGDGVKGKILPNGSQVRATFRIGGGPEGSRPGVGKITTIIDNKGANIVSSVINLTKPSGGRVGQTLKEFKDNFPDILTSNERVVSFNDAVAELQNSGIGVHRAKAYKGQGPYEYVIIVAAAGGYPIPTGYWNSNLKVGSGLLGTVGEYIIDKIVGSLVLTIKSVDIVPIISRMNIYCTRRSYQNIVRENVKNSISNYLSSDNFEINESLNLVEFGKMLDNVDGVDKVEILEFRRSPLAYFVKGNDSVIFSNYNVGQNITEELWRILFTDSNGFKVIGDYSGEQSSLGAADGSKYLNDNSALSFYTSYVVGDPPYAGTEYIIRTSKYKADTIILDDNEIITEGTTTINMFGGRV